MGTSKMEEQTEKQDTSDAVDKDKETEEEPPSYDSISKNPHEFENPGFVLENPAPLTAMKGSGFSAPAPLDTNIQISPPCPMVPTLFGKQPILVTCPNCRKIGSTRVLDSVSQSGWVWAILCCFLGSWLLSFFACCVDCFRKWTHSCPSCNTVVGVHEPKASAGTIVALVLSSILVFGLVVAFVILKFSTLHH